MKRNKHTLSHYRLISARMGSLYPIAHLEVLPGDSIQMSTDALVRCAPLNTPVMHPVQVRIHHFYVPYRLLWDGWEKFITGEDTTPPPVTSTGTSTSDLRYYLGLPPRAGVPVSAFPIRAYNKIWNEHYRDQDLQPEVLETSVALQKCAWEKDYFTTARPWTQKGDAVTIPVGDRAPVKGIGANNTNWTDPPQAVHEADGEQRTYANAKWINHTAGANSQFQVEKSDLGDYPNIYADLSQATSVDINDFRKAFALQRYQEARARYGSRFSEYLRYLGIRPSDARLQRSEYLGGGQSRLNFSEVLQTTTTAAANRNGVGDMWGHGISGVKGNRFRKFFEEHGIVMSLMSVRPKAIYQEGVHRSWLRTTKEDYWQKELEHIGQQGIKKDEIYADAGNDSAPWGYCDRYREYREHPSMVIGDFRDKLNMWHLGRALPSDTALNGSFVECNPSGRIFQVTSGDNLWCMVNNHIVARRLVSKTASARIL